jgi:hypothetical protein
VQRRDNVLWQASFVEDVNAYLAKAATTNPRLRYNSVEVLILILSVVAGVMSYRYSNAKVTSNPTHAARLYGSVCTKDLHCRLSWRVEESTQASLLALWPRPGWVSMTDAPQQLPV